MESSKIYDLLDVVLLGKWKDEIEKTENETWFFKNEQDSLKELEAELSEKGKTLLTSYAFAMENRIDYVYYNLKIKALNFGIKIGMELKTAFAEFEE